MESMQRRQKVLTLISVLCLAGAALSLFSLYLHTKADSPVYLGESFCEINERFNCLTVYRSKWSLVFGVPVAALALCYYLVLFSLSLLARDERNMSAESGADIFFTLGFASVLYSAFLWYVSVSLVGSQCVVCLAMDGINLALFAATGLLPGASVAGRIPRGVRYLAAYPAAVIGLGKYANLAKKRLLRWSLVVSTLMLVLSILTVLPFRFYWHKQVEIKNAELAAKIGGLVAKWEGAQRQNITVNSESGLSMDYSQGPAFAPIQIVEFVDLECPACRASFQMLEEFLPQFGNSVRLVLKNYPLNESCNPYIQGVMHPNACFAAHFARCAGEQGAFWPVVSYLFDLEELSHGATAETVNKAAFALCEELKLDAEALKECMDSARHVNKVRGDVQEGAKLGLEVTPSMWVNGKRVEAIHPDVLKPIFEKILSASSGRK